MQLTGARNGLMGDKAIKALALLLGIFFVILAVVAARWGIADYHYEKAYDLLTGWQDGKELNITNWQQAHTSLENTLALDPTNSDYLLAMGRLKHIRMHPSLSSVDDYKEYGEQAKVLFRQSIEVRPRWPYAWANLALLKRDLGEFDAELDHAIQQAVTYGPWENDVQRQIAITGLSHYHIYSEPVRELIADNIKRGLLSPYSRAWGQMVAILKDYPAAMEGPVVGRIAEVLTEGAWEHVMEGGYTQLGFWLWSEMAAEHRRAFIGRLVEAINASKNPANILGVVARYNQLLQVCVRLPRGELYAQYCSSNRITPNLR